MDGWESGLVVVAVMATLSFLFRAITNKANAEAQYASAWKLPTEFRLASWALNFYRYGLVLSIIGALIIFGLMESGPTRNVALFTPGLFTLLTGLGLIVDTKRKVIITEEIVRYRSVFGSFELPLNRIKRVRSASGFIILDVGEKTKKVIPLVFQGNGQILAILQSKAQSARAGND